MSWLGSALSNAASATSIAASSLSSQVHSAVSGAVLPTRDSLFREAMEIQSRVAGSAKMWDMKDSLSPSLLELLMKDGFETSADHPNKWIKGEAVRVPWRLISDDVEGVLTMSMTKTSHGAIGVRLELDSQSFPKLFRPIVREAVGNFSVPIPAMGFQYGGIAVGFFAYVDISETGSRTFVVRMGAKFEFKLGISLLPEALTKPFPQPLPIVFKHDFSEIYTITNDTEHSHPLISKDGITLETFEKNFVIPMSEGALQK